MRFTVVCLPTAEAKLARIWLRAIDRPGISLAADDIDQFLRDSPETVGEPLANSYVIKRGPLMAEYQFFPEDCLVQILNYELNLS
jgi:hypothetical protein